MTHVYTLRLPEETWKALETIKQRDGVPFAEQLRRAVEQWIAVNKTGGAR